MTARTRKSTPWRCARCSQPVELRHAVKHYVECQQRDAADVVSTTEVIER